MLVKFAAALCVFAIAASAQDAKDDKKEEKKDEGLKPDEAGGRTEFVVIKADKSSLNLKNIKSQNFGLIGAHEAYKGTWGGTMFRLMMTIQSPTKLVNGHYYQSYVQQLDEIKTKEANGRKYYEDMSCTIKYETRLDSKGIIPRANYFMHEGCGHRIISKTKASEDRLFGRRVNDPSLMGCASWENNQDNSAVGNKGPLFFSTCSAKRDYASKISGIKMKVGEKQRFIMGFNVFASAEDDAPKFANVGK
jgi:hypothetical protein